MNYENTTHEFEPANEETESQRTAEVEELLSKQGITRGEIEAKTEEIFTCGNIMCHDEGKEFPRAFVKETPEGPACMSCGDRYSIYEKTPHPMINVPPSPVEPPAPASAAPDSQSRPEPIRHNQGGYPGGPVAPINGTATKIADELVPAFGETLEKYEAGALAFGFPPAVDALITKTGIDGERAEMVLVNFRNAFALAGAWKQRAEAIVVTDETQTDLILEAKRLHKIVRDDRINVEKKRKELKERPLREGQLIDGVANVYKDLLEPIETHLLAQAKFVENIEAERKAKLAEDRGAKLALFDVDPKAFPNLGDMSEEAFEMVYNGVRQKYQEIQDQAKARIEAERKHEIENERLRQENERLEAERKAETERAAEQQRIADEATAKLKAAEEAEARKEADRKAEEERMKLAPDRNKLLALVAAIEAIHFPEVDPKFADLLADVDKDLQSACGKIQRFISSNNL